jgi:hypothetical protein
MVLKRNDKVKIIDGSYRNWVGTFVGYFDNGNTALVAISPQFADKTFSDIDLSPSIKEFYPNQIVFYDDWEETCESLQKEQRELVSRGLFGQAKMMEKKYQEALRALI